MLRTLLSIYDEPFVFHYFKEGMLLLELVFASSQQLRVPILFSALLLTP